MGVLFQLFTALEVTEREQKQDHVNVHVSITCCTLTFGTVYHNICTVKPVLSDLAKIGKTKDLKTDGSLMQVESIAECYLGAFCNTSDLH